MDRLNNAIRLIESVSFLAVCIAFLIKDNLDICYIMASLGILGFIALIVLILHECPLKILDTIKF